MASIPSSAASDIVAIQGRIEGLVESFDLTAGISGWAIDLEQPGARLAVELVIGDLMIGRTIIEHARNDLPIAPGHALVAGFSFDESLRDRLRAAVAAGAQGRLGVRVVGAGSFLPSLTEAPDAAEAIAMTSAPSQEDAGFDLVTRLSQQRAKAAAMPRTSLRADPANLVGFIEEISIDDGGLVWFNGWAKAGLAGDMPVLIYDGQRAPGAIATTMYPREDLGNEAYGVIGVIQSDWQPTPGTELYVFLEDGKSYVQSVKILKLSSKRDFTGHFSFRWASCFGGHRQLLRHLLDHPDSWQPTDGLSGARVQATLEEVYVLPSFGCLVIGWALSPLKTVEGFAMRFGSTILECDRDSINFRSRPDLRAAVSGCDLLTERAGFVAVFRGTIASHEVDSPTLKIFLGDGTASIHAVDAGAVRRIGLAASIEQVRHLYPALSSESFFPALALAMRNEARARAAKVMTVQIEPSPTALIFSVPPERSDAFLLFEEVGRRIRGKDVGTGLIFIADRGTIRPTAIALFKELVAATTTSCSLFLADNAAGALYAVPQLLAAAGTDRFAFFGAAMLVTDAGWQAALEGDGDLTLFAPTDPANGAGEAPVTLECFAWRREPFVNWLDMAPPFIGGPRTSAAHHLGDIPYRTVRHGAQVLRRESPTTLVRAINEVGAP